jgi:hypothetical protein
MVIDMNEAQVRTVERCGRLLEGTQALEFRRAEDNEGRYRWIGAVLRRFDYRQLPREDRAPVLAYLKRLSGYSRRASGAVLQGAGAKPGDQDLRGHLGQRSEDARSGQH